MNASSVRSPLPCALLGVWLALFPALALAEAAPADGAARPPAPAEDCLDARRIELARRLPDGELLVTAAGGGYRVALQAGCPVDPAAADLALLAPHGWVCGDGGARLRGGDDGCLVTGVARLGAREHAELARVGDRALLGASTVLEGVEVRAKAPRRRGFPASYAYCLPIDDVRGFSVKGDGIRVEVSPHRTGGHRWYQVDLQRSCPELETTSDIGLSSGMGLGLLCGNPGDSVRARVDSRFDGPSLRQDCPVAAVYPVGG